MTSLLRVRAGVRLSGPIYWTIPFLGPGLHQWTVTAWPRIQRWRIKCVTETCCGKFFRNTQDRHNLPLVRTELLLYVPSPCKPPTWHGQQRDTHTWVSQVCVNRCTQKDENKLSTHTPMWSCGVASGKKLSCVCKWRIANFATSLSSQNSHVNGGENLPQSLIPTRTAADSELLQGIGWQA